MQSVTKNYDTFGRVVSVILVETQRRATQQQPPGVYSSAGACCRGAEVDAQCKKFGHAFIMSTSPSSPAPVCLSVCLPLRIMIWSHFCCCCDASTAFVSVLLRVLRSMVNDILECFNHEYIAPPPRSVCLSSRFHPAIFVLLCFVDFLCSFIYSLFVYLLFFYFYLFIIVLGHRVCSFFFFSRRFLFHSFYFFAPLFILILILFSCEWGSHVNMFAALTGAGAQLCVVTMCLLVCALLGVFKPTKRGSILTCILVLYSLTAWVAGFLSARQVEGVAGFVSVYKYDCTTVCGLL